eukprot:CAMPEP_0204357282 /NCGR_PEP_ID=MMETSP0469-20131031/35617_1 /ASSEMBLY_ACC=CAM_ASM_000384 /TAXON_ID=2969 /ORGANISM="Oxyrrhis marina" /LENGTH=464 /DNA_ID=CAMNT_0051344915 /DNA_START=43 /DNA_END=1437 /DNA_ORIENTATION=-
MQFMEQEDEYEEDSGENICERMCGALCSSICGVVMIICCVVLVFWNENNLVIHEATVLEIEDAKVYQSCVPDPTATGKLVLVACDVYTPDIASSLPDPLTPFLDHFSGASVSWSMQIYQWVQTSSEDCHKTNNGGQSCRTTYSYNAQWTSSPTDSNSFHRSSGHDNRGTRFPTNLQPTGQVNAPASTVVLSQSGTPDKGFVVNPDLVTTLPSIDLGDKLKAPAAPAANNHNSNWQGGGSLTPAMLHVYQNGLQTSTGAPSIGDLRIQLTGQTAQEATACAVQLGISGASSQYTFGPLPPQSFGWFGKKTKPLQRLQTGKVSQEEFMKQFYAEGQTMAWLIRIGSLALMTMAFWMVLSPLSVAADGLMFLNYCTCGLGSVLDSAAQCLIGTAAFFLALMLTAITIALAWFAARPALALGLVAGALAIHLIFVLTQGGGRACGCESDSDSDDDDQPSARQGMIPRM